MSKHGPKRPRRRSFLRGIAGASLAIPTLSSLLSRTGRAQAVPRKQRILFLYMPHHDTDGFDPGANFDFTGSYLAPVGSKYASRMLVMNDMKTVGQGHSGGHTEWLTGWPGGDDLRPVKGPSLDVMISKRLAGVTPLPLLNFSMSWRVSINAGVTSWNEGDAPTAIPGISSPVDAFTRVYGNSPSAMPPAGPDKALVAQGSLLDALAQDYARVSTSMSVADRRLLDQHLSLVRDQEKALQQSIMTPFSCTTGAGKPAATLDWQSTLRSYMDSIVGAFRCDATRVATMCIGCSGDDSNYTFLDPRATNYHDNVAHGNQDLVKLVRQWQWQQIAYLCDQLNAVDEGNGSGTLLDNTLIAVLPELGWFPANGMLTYVDAYGKSQTTDNNHLRFRVPAVLIGSAGGYFGTGRYLDMQQAHYHDLLLTLAQAMGLTDVTTFGQAGTGPLANLKA